MYYVSRVYSRKASFAIFRVNLIGVEYALILGNEQHAHSRLSIMRVGSMPRFAITIYTICYDRIMYCVLFFLSVLVKMDI